MEVFWKVGPLNPNRSGISRVSLEHLDNRDRFKSLFARTKIRMKQGPIIQLEILHPQTIFDVCYRSSKSERNNSFGTKLEWFSCVVAGGS